MYDLLNLLCDELEAGRPAAVATVVFQKGSAPRGAGARLVAGKGGLLGGTTGGGLAEAQAIAACAQACESGQVRLLDIDMTGSLAARAEMICGGKVRVLIEPFLPDDPNHLRMAQIVRGFAKSGGCHVLRPFPPSRTAWSMMDGAGTWHGEALPPALAGELAAHLPLAAEAAVLELGGAEYFVEQCQPRERMFIAGGGHVSLPVARIAQMTDFAVHVLDDRPEYANNGRFPHAETHVVADYEDCFARLDVTARDHIVIVTRGHLYDGKVLTQALRTQAGYIGMIGSKGKRAQIYADLRRQGFDEAAIARVHSPIGLGIGAETPEEIAVSILAECIAHRRGALA